MNRGSMTTHLRHRQHGFSLVELMIAMAIGLALLAGVTHIFTSSKATQDPHGRLPGLRQPAFHDPE